MSSINTLAVLRGSYGGVVCLTVSALLGCASADPVSGSSGPRLAAPAATGSQEMVDCLLPGQIRRLDETVTYPTERRPVRTTKADCTARGGVAQSLEGSIEAPSQSGK